MKKRLRKLTKPASMYCLLVLFLLGLGSFSTSAQTQTKAVSGIVSDTNKLGIPGVTVLVKGTKTSAVTDLDGNYKINVPATKAILVFSYVGFDTKQIAVETNSRVNATLKESTSQLNEVVIVGYGTQKKENLTGAVSTVTSKLIDDRPVTSLATALQGTVPGMNVTRTSGQPGNESIAIQIRGVTSANGAVNPLLLIDGVATPLFNLQTINPLDVESISVLKDGAAAAIYGAQAAGGVILVTTKQGKSGKTVFEYSSQLAGQKPVQTPDRLTLLQEATMANLASVNGGGGIQYDDTALQIIKDGIEYLINPNDISGNTYIYYNQKDLRKTILRDISLIKTHNLSARGGTEKSNYLLSLGYLDQEGMFKVGKDNFSRFNLRMNVGTDLSKYVHLDTRISYAEHNTDSPGQEVNGRNGQGALLATLYKARLRFPFFTPEGNYASQTSGNNAYAYLKDGGYNKRIINDLDGNFKLTIKDLAKGLKFTTIYGRKLNMTNTSVFKRTVELWGRLRPVSLLNPINSFDTSMQILKTENFQFLTDYNLTIAKNHKFTLLGGYQWEDSRLSRISAGAVAIKSNELPSLNLGEETSKTNSQTIQTFANQSYFGRFNYSYKGKYLAEATLRSDESSRLAPGLRIKTFPSASLGWNIHKEELVSRIAPFISELKPRVSWGQLGNAQGIGLYDYLYTLNNGANLVLGGTEPKTAYFFQNSVSSDQLSWETVQTYNYGFDFGLFKNKLTGSFDYYEKMNKNMLNALTLPATFGVNEPKINNGVLKSWGWEFAINYRDKIGTDFNYDIGFNLSDNQNILVEYTGVTRIASGRNTLIKGFPLNTVWGYKTRPGYFSSQEQITARAFFPANADPKLGDIEYLDQDGNNLINQGKQSVEDHGDLVQLGVDQQRYLFGMNANANWKNIDFSIFIQGVGKRGFNPDNEMIAPLSDAFISPLDIHLDYWTLENPNAAFPRLSSGSRTWNYVASDRWFLDGAYVRLKNIQLGYSLTKSMLEKTLFSQVRFYLSGENIATITKLGIFGNVFDPEQKSEVYADYPLFGTVSFGVNIKF